MTSAPEPVGLCACCGQPVHPGEERLETIEVGTGVAPDVLLHKALCHPPEVRRYPHSGVSGGNSAPE